MSTSLPPAPERLALDFGHGDGGTVKTGAQDRDARARRGDLMQDNGASEAQRGAQPFEGSFTVVQGAGNSNGRGTPEGTFKRGRKS
jgi:hypothetical protein